MRNVRIYGNGDSQRNNSGAQQGCVGGVIAQGEEIEQAVERADKLMYAAKSQKSCVVTDVDEEVL